MRQSDVLDNLFAIRRVHDPSFLSYLDVGPPLYLVNPAFPPPPPGVEPRRLLEKRNSTFEYVVAETGRNLDNAPGAVQNYSNLGFVVLQVVAEYTAGAPDSEYGDVWGGAMTAHTDHVGSRLDGFEQTYLGGWPGDDDPRGAVGSRYGMFVARTPDPTAEPDAQIDPGELQPRDWVGGTWNPDRDDAKGIVCFPDGQGRCIFVVGMVDGFGNAGQVPYGYHGTMMQEGAGGMVTEADLYLRYMSRFLVGFGWTFPGYGRTRTSWSQSATHNGQWVGARSTVRQIGWRIHKDDPMCNARYVSPVPDDGTLICPPGATCCPTNFECVRNGAPALPVDTQDTSNNQCVRTTPYRVPFVQPWTGDYGVDDSAAGTRRCVLPEGLDIFVATNQASDGEDLDGDDYTFLIDAVIAGLCQVEWPHNPYTLLPDGPQYAP